MRSRPAADAECDRRLRIRKRSALPILATLGLLAATVLLGACEDDADAPGTTADDIAVDVSDSQSGDPGRVVKVDGDRRLYVRCTGSGEPTVVMEGGDDDTSDSYYYAEEKIARETRTCVYDRANLGQSDPAPGPRELEDFVGDLEALLASADVPGPYVLVGTSGGGFITAGYAFEHPDDVAGMVFVDTGAPFDNPPRAIIKATDPGNPDNIEKRDYLQIERDAWAAREPIGDIPIKVISVDFAKAAIQESPFPTERALMERNIERQKGWLVLSPSAEQLVAHTGHAVEEEDPKLVVDAILDVVHDSRQ